MNNETARPKWINLLEVYCTSTNCMPGLLHFFKVLPQRPIAFLQKAHSRRKMRESCAAIAFPVTTVLLRNISHLIGVFDLK